MTEPRPARLWRLHVTWPGPPPDLRGLSRRVFQSRDGAHTRAAKLRALGATVDIEPSLPIVFPSEVPAITDPDQLGTIKIERRGDQVLAWAALGQTDGTPWAVIMNDRTQIKGLGLGLKPIRVDVTGLVGASQ